MTMYSAHRQVCFNNDLRFRLICKRTSKWSWFIAYACNSHPKVVIKNVLHACIHSPLVSASRLYLKKAIYKHFCPERLKNFASYLYRMQARRILEMYLKEELRSHGNVVKEKAKTIRFVFAYMGHTDLITDVLS